MNLDKTDPQISNLVKQEQARQQNSLQMIPSENHTSGAVLEALATVLVNKYSEGYPKKRYYQGNTVIDEIELLAIDRAKKLFGVPHVNVQPYSGSPANTAIYFALLEPLRDKIMGLSLAFGGHLTHGSPVSISGKYFKAVPYELGKDDRLDYDAIEKLAITEKPKVIVCGYTAYPRTINFKRFGEIADSVGAYLLADISHIAGLVAGGAHPSPVPYVHIVMTTTHKTLRGPRGAIIICKKELAKNINKAIFPGLQGGPLENVIAGKAIAFIETQTPQFKKDQVQTVKNAQVLAETLKANGLKLIADSTQNHLVLVDCRSLNISGKVGAEALAVAGIYTNANMIPYDPATPLNPSGIRIGTPALTTRQMKEKEMKIIGQWIADILKNPTDQKLKLQIKKNVLRLTKKFPIYK